MRTRFNKFLNVLAFSFLFAICTNVQKVYAQYDDVYGNEGGAPTYQTFYDDLSAYGQWVQDPEYGYVWVPNAEPGFRPYYSGGHWVMTEYGNTWVSDYPWGWAAFHYGRWTYNPYYGWVWIPGYTWGPAWVGWRYGGGYYGWAPLGPGFTFGVGFGDYYCPDDWWIFIAPTYLYSPHYYRYWYGPRENGTIIRHTEIIRNTYNNRNVTYVTGPRTTEYQRVTGQSVPVYHLANSSSRTSTAIRGNELHIYHPMEIRQTGPRGVNPVPPNAVRAPQSIGKPQGTGVNAETPAFRNEVRSGNVVPVPQPVQQQNRLPITPQRKEVIPRHQIQTDEHIAPPPAPARPQQPIINREQPGERVPQQNFDRQPQRPEPQQVQPSRPTPQPVQPSRPAPPQVQPSRPAPQMQPQRPMQPQRMPQVQPSRPSAPPMRNEGGRR